MTLFEDALDFSIPTDNPLDLVEDVLKSNNWVFSRLSEEELVVKVQGRNCLYSICFVWQEAMNALQFCCEYDLSIPDSHMDRAAAALLSLNESLWMGHFDISRAGNIPAFRHTCLLRGMSEEAGYEFLEDMVDIGLESCERHYGVFHLLSRAGGTDDRILSLALMETAGEC